MSIEVLSLRRASQKGAPQIASGEGRGGLESGMVTGVALINSSDQRRLAGRHNCSEQLEFAWGLTCHPRGQKLYKRPEGDLQRGPDVSHSVCAWLGA